MSHCINGMDMMMYCPSVDCAYHQALADVEREKKLKEHQFNTDDYIKISAKKDERIAELEARCKELEAELSTTVSNAMTAGKLEMQKITEFESENRILKAKLEKCKEQRNIQIKHHVTAYEVAFSIEKDTEIEIEKANKELDSIGEK